MASPSSPLSPILSPGHLQALAAVGEERTAAKGEFLFRIGDARYPLIVNLQSSRPHDDERPPRELEAAEIDPEREPAHRAAAPRLDRDRAGGVEETDAPCVDRHLHGAAGERPPLPDPPAEHVPKRRPGRRAHDLATGQRTHAWLLRRGETSSTLRDVHAGVAVLTVPEGVRLVRLADGRVATVAVPRGVETAGAQLEQLGLVYAYVERNESPTSRILFVSHGPVQRRLGESTRTLRTEP